MESELAICDIEMHPRRKILSYRKVLNYALGILGVTIDRGNYFSHVIR
jgi:hypothetical protein